MPEIDVTFTAQWVAVYTVKYVLNGGAGAVPAETLRTVNYGETLTAVVPTRTGFNFAGWKDQSGTTIPSGAGNWRITSTSFIALAHWTPIQVQLALS